MAGQQEKTRKSKWEKQTKVEFKTPLITTNALKPLPSKFMLKKFTVKWKCLHYYTFDQNILNQYEQF